MVPKVFSAQTLRPDILQAEADALRYLLLSEDALSRAQKRDILLAGIDLETLRERGFTENQVLEAVVTTSFAGFFNVDEELYEAPNKEEEAGRKYEENRRVDDVCSEATDKI